LPWTLRWRRPNRVAVKDPQRRQHRDAHIPSISAHIPPS
jgi:hypothetical protein